MSFKIYQRFINRYIRPHVWILTVTGFIVMAPVYLTKIVQYFHYLVGVF
jgi:hypothetical protein